MQKDHLENQNASLHVLIIGGGIGGLCLAQGLKKSGISVAVYERDRSAHFRNQGYRIAIKENGSQALRDCLPENLFKLCMATAIKTATRLVFLDEHLNQKFVKPLLHSPLPDDMSFGVNRLTLRQILLANLEGIVHFGKTCTRFDQVEDGQVQAYFTDGTSATGDLLVGADGTNSGIRDLIAPDARIDTLHYIIYGKTLIKSDTIAWVPEILVDGFVSIVSLEGTRMGVATCRQVESTAETLAKFAPTLHLTKTPDYFSWTLPLIEELRHADAQTLHRQALSLVRGWHLALQRLIEEATVSATFPVCVSSSRPFKQWGTPNVTLLGDAVHSMSPSRGEGAGVALQDAQLLRHALIDVVTNRVPLAQAKAQYEREMLRYGFEAVANSLNKPFLSSQTG